MRRRLTIVAVAFAVCCGMAVGVANAEPPVSSSPPDVRNYNRALVPEERPASREGSGRKVLTTGAADTTPTVFLFDTIVANTNANLATTDTFNDGETSIAINPANPDEITVSAFSGGWGANAPIFHSTNGGNLWTKQFTIPRPPGTAAACPCDQTFDYARGNQLSGTFLHTNLFTGTTTNPAAAASWNWLLDGSGNAVDSNLNPMPDQPWLLVNRDPTTASQDNVYVGYDDFSVNPVDTRVAVSLGANPPNMTRDQITGETTGGGINPGHRLATDPRNGTVYSLFQQNANNDSGNAKQIRYRLNRSTDGGQTWTLNGSTDGVTVATAFSVQPTPKFGGVNALLGGVNHAAVDPSNGDVYYVYGERDANNNNRLSIRRLTDNGSGGLNIGAATDVTGAVDAALPSVAVTTDGRVGVMYYTFDGTSASGFPEFSTHLAVSDDNGATFDRQTLSEFVSPAMPDASDNRQRVYGDYHQLKTIGEDFFGAFTGNGAVFGRATSNNDPIFFTTREPPEPELSISDATVTEGDAGSQLASFDVTLSHGDSRAISATVTTSDGTATAPSDYTHTATTVNFAAGETEKTVTVPVNGDIVDELDETFQVTVSNTPAFVQVVDGTGIGTILDNDEAKLSVADVTVTEGSSGTTPADFEVTLSNPADRTVKANFATADGTATAPQDYAQTAGTVEFAPFDQAETITVPVVGDTVDELQETFSLTLSAPVVATIADGQAIGTIVDDDRDGVFTCRATALRAFGSETAVANPPDNPCGDDARTAATVRVSAGLVSVGVNDLAARTDQTPDVLAGTTPAAGDRAVAEAHSGAITIRVGLLSLIRLGGVDARAEARCPGGSAPPALSSSSSVSALTLNGQPIAATSNPLVLSIPLVGTLRLNQQQVVGTRIVRRAFVLDTLLAPDIVIGEATAGYAGTPVHPNGHPCTA